MKEPKPSSESLDVVVLEPTTAAYKVTDFEPLVEVIDPIVLTGHSTDQGIDTNGNRLFENLTVAVELKLTTTDFYEWSASLVDVEGTEIGFDSRSATLNAGTATIHLNFDSKLIGNHCVNGPYWVRGLLIYGKQKGVNLVSLPVAKTQAYSVRQFEQSQDCAKSVILESFAAD